MSLKSVMAVTAAMLCACTIAKGDDGWGQLKAGMTRVDAVSSLGTPLFKNLGRGFELWIYDRGAEIVCYRGMLVAWTAPGGLGGTEGRQLDLRAFLRATPPPTPVGTPDKDAAEPTVFSPLRTMRLPHL
jgi:hypothetical protein